LSALHIDRRSQDMAATMKVGLRATSIEAGSPAVIGVEIVTSLPQLKRSQCGTKESMRLVSPALRQRASLDGRGLVDDAYAASASNGRSAMGVSSRRKRKPATSRYASHASELSAQVMRPTGRQVRSRVTTRSRRRSSSCWRGVAQWRSLARSAVLSTFTLRSPCGSARACRREATRLHRRLCAYASKICPAP
jgi:hypothetical protein